MAINQQAPTVVYPYKHTNSEELAWSIKSLKNVEHGQVMIVGDSVPGHEVTQSLINSWSRNSRYHDTINKYYTACMLAETDELLLMNDDFFIMSPWVPVNYNRGTLVDHMQWRKGKDDYQRMLELTNRFLLSKGIANLSFELHAPMLVNRLLLKQAIEEIMPQLRLRRTLCLRSYYGNRFNIESEYMADVKNPTNPESMTLLSTNNRAFMSDLGNYIRSKLCE